jgi:hypothetical protein
MRDSVSRCSETDPDGVRKRAYGSVFTEPRVTSGFLLLYAYIMHEDVKCCIQFCSFEKEPHKEI